MFFNSINHIFIYNRPVQSFPFFAQINDFDTFSAFSTNNIYQLHQYTQKIVPQLLVFNIINEKSLSELKILIENRASDFPLIVVSPAYIKIPPYPQIAHYVTAENEKQLQDIIESYSIGGKTHDILLVDAYNPQVCPFKESLYHKGYSVFEVHNIEAAQQYLMRNKPRIVGVEYAPNFIPARHTLQHNRIFYVDRAQDITEIEKFLH